MGKKQFLATLSVLLVVFLGSFVFFSLVKGPEFDQAYWQKRLVAGERVVYLFDSSSGMCAHAWKGVRGFDHTFNWVVPCVSVKDKLVPMNSDWQAIYLFDPDADICMVRYRAHNEVTGSWPVPCATVIDKLDPSVRKQVEAMLKRFSPECPR